MRILWLYGPPGVGKSTTAWAALNLLADQGVSTAYVDIDQLGMVVPAPDDDPHAERLAARVLAAVAPEYERSGAETLVVSGVLDLDLMPFYRELLEPFGLAWCVSRSTRQNSGAGWRHEVRTTRSGRTSSRRPRRSRTRPRHTR